MDFIIKRHNEIKDLTASLLRDVTSTVEIEPNLQPLTGEVMTEWSAISKTTVTADWM